MRAAVTFVIPTTQERLRERVRAIESVYAQTDPDWLAVVCGSGFVPDLAIEARTYAVKGPVEGGKATARNMAMRHVHFAASTHDVDTDWLAFLDDQDTVSDQYVARLREIKEAADIVVFRMNHPRIGIVPDLLFPSLVAGQIGPNFAVRRAFAHHFALEFRPRTHISEAFFFRDANRCGARVLIHPSICYFAEDARP